MAFEVPPTRVVSRRTRWAAVPVIAAALVITAVAFASKTAPGSSLAPVPSSGLPASSSAAAVAGLDASAAASGLLPALASTSPDPAGEPPTQSIAPRLPARPVPAALRCITVDAASCVSMAEAALRTIPDEGARIRRASVWRSLLCDSSLDCPPALLRSVVPLGSVVLELSDGGPSVWVNVVGWRTLTESSAGLQLQAWIVRS